MKKNKYMYLFAVVLGLGVSACSSDDLATEEQGMQGTGAAATEGTGVVFTSKIVDELDMLDGEEEQTRSAIVSGQIARWTKGDAVSVSDGTLAYTYQVKETVSGTSCSFEVKEGSREFTDDASGRNFYAFYPEAAITGAAGRGGWNGSKVKAMIFAEQKYAENMDDGLFGAYMASEATELKDGSANFTFHLVASVIDVNLADLGVTPKSVSLRANSGVSLAGLLAYNCASGTASVSTADRTDYAASTQSEVVTVSGIASGATLVRLYVLPVVLDGGVTITVQDTDGNFYTKTASATVGNPATEGLTSIDGLAGATVCKPYYKKFNFGAASKATRKNNWMATIPGNVPFCQLSVPGAHDAATKGATSLAKTQSKTIADLLEAGVRGFDLRPRYNSNTQSDIELDNLEIYHGSASTGVKFKDAMSTLVGFVHDNPTEGLYVRIKKENSKLLTEPKDQSETWRISIRTCLGGYYDSGEVLGRITADMTLNDCRGKLVVTADNPYGEEGSYEGIVYGGRLSWDEDTQGQDYAINHTWNSWVAGAYVQDYYSGNQNTKYTCIDNIFAKSSADLGNKWYICFLNMETISNAKQINPQTTEKLNAISGRVGFVFYDFCGDDSYGGETLNKTIIGQNYKYVYNNRSRVHMPDNTGTGIDGGEMADDSEVYSIEMR